MTETACNDVLYNNNMTQILFDKIIIITIYVLCVEVITLMYGKRSKDCSHTYIRSMIGKYRGLV